MRALLIAIMSLLSLSAYSAETDSIRYASRHFRAIGDAIALPERLSADSIISFNGRPLTIEYDRFGQVSHIGYRLFHRDNLGAPLADVLRFVERYALENDLNLEATDISEASSLDIPLLREDYPYTLASMADTDSMDLSVNDLDGKQLSVVWSDPSGKGVSVMFPANHNRILGYAIDELADRLIRQITDFPEDAIPLDAEATQLVKAEPFEFLQIPDHSYILDALTDARYYEEYKGEIYPLEDMSYPAHVLANLLTGNDIYNTIDINLKLEGNPPSMQAPMKSLVGYFRAEGCHPYFGVSSYEGSEIRGVAVYVNPMLGYCHVLKVVCDDRMLINFEGTCEGRLVPYVPISKINNLFDN